MPRVCPVLRPTICPHGLQSLPPANVQVSVGTSIWAWHLPHTDSLGAEMCSALETHSRTQMRVLGKGPPSSGQGWTHSLGGLEQTKEAGPLLEIKIASCPQQKVKRAAASGIPGQGNRGPSQAPHTLPRAPSPAPEPRACPQGCQRPTSILPQSPRLPPKLGAPVKFSSCRNSAPQRMPPQPRGSHPAR